MSTRARSPLTPDEFESLKNELFNARLTDSQITDLALILNDKFKENQN